MIALLLVPAVIVLLIVWLRSEIAGPEESKRLSRIDRDLDRDYPQYRHGGGWRH